MTHYDLNLIMQGFIPVGTHSTEPQGTFQPAVRGVSHATLILVTRRNTKAPGSAPHHSPSDHIGQCLLQQTSAVRL